MISKEFLFAGNSIFTVSNDKGEHYTYKVTTAVWNNEQKFFISVLSGPDNNSDYVYVGMIKNSTRVLLTAKSKFRHDSKAFRIARFALDIVNGFTELPPGYDIQHEGKCGRCGRKLTTPESINLGLGPVCATKGA